MIEKLIQEDERKSVYVITDGCTEGRMDAALLERFFRDRTSYRLCTDYTKADIIVFIGCCATQDREDLSCRIIEALRMNRHQGTEMLVSGCIARRRPELRRNRADLQPLADEIDRLLRLEGEEDLAANFPKPEFWEIGSDVLGHGVADDLIRRYCRRDVGGWLFRGFPRLRTGLIRLFTRYRRLIDPEMLASPTRTYCIRVSTGCMGNCAYCSIKLSRGRIKSRSLTGIVNEFRQGRDKGYTDFSLLGTDVGDYGRDLGIDLLDLLTELVRHEGRFTLRLRNVNPRWLIPSVSPFCELLKTGKIGYILSPVESGSDRTLERMNRGYRAEDYIEAVRRVRTAWPRIFIKTQVVVGFPGETDADFAKTLELLKLGLFDYADVCAFTRRPRTQASYLPGEVPDMVVAERYRRLQLQSFVWLPLRRWLAICALRRR